jgi:hypothetical protein
MIYTWKLSPLRHLLFDSDRPMVLGGRAMAVHRSHSPIRGQVIAATAKRVVLKTKRGTRSLSRSTWVIAPIYGERNTMSYVPALLKELAARDRNAG